MIQGYVGVPGSGKTYTMVADVLKRLDRSPSLLAFSNFDIKHPRAHRIRTMDDMLLCPPGLIVVDEIHMWFDSRRSMQLPDEFLMQLSQTRKAGWNMLWTTQHESNVDKRVRNNTNFVWLCAAWFGAKSKGLDQGHFVPADTENPIGGGLEWVEPDPEKRVGHPLFFTARCYQPNDVERARGTQKGKVKPRKYGRRARVFSKRVALAYGTYEQIEAASHFNTSSDEYRGAAQLAKQRKLEARFA